MALKFLGYVSAGFPSPADEYKEEVINLTEQLKLLSDSVFVLRVEGDSMVDAHIPKGAYIVVDKNLRPPHNAIVVGVIHGEVTVKYMVKTQFGLKLIAANKRFKDIEITEDMNFMIWGVVTHVVIDLKKMII